MKNCEIALNLKHGKKRIKIRAKKAEGFLKARGLMLSSGRNNLLFEFKRDVRTPMHSWFVFFPFVIIWLDKNNRLLEFRIAKPFESFIMPKKKFRKALEIPLNRKTKEGEFFLKDYRRRGKV